MHNSSESKEREAKQEEEEQLQGQASLGRVPKRRRHNPTEVAHTQPEAPSSPSPEEDPQEGPLALLPEGVLDHMISLLAAEEGGSCIRSTCRWLRSTFGTFNTRLVLRGPLEHLPGGFLARLQDIVRCNPCVSSLTLARSFKSLTWPQVLEAGGPQLLHRLERLALMHFPFVSDLEALAACTRLQHLCLLGFEYYHHPALQLHPLAACGGTLRHLEIQYCRSARDFTFLAACAALQHLILGACNHLVDLTPLAACVQLQTLHITGGLVLKDLDPLAACVGLQDLDLSGCSQLSDLSPLASCAALQHLALGGCGSVVDLAPLAACVNLRQLDLDSLSNVHDLGPLAACVALKALDLTHCRRVEDLGPLAACVGLQVLKLWGCKMVEDLSPLAACTKLQDLSLYACSSRADLGPLAACLGLESLDLRECGAGGRSSIAALPLLRIFD